MAICLWPHFLTHPAVVALFFIDSVFQDHFCTVYTVLLKWLITYDAQSDCYVLTYFTLHFCFVENLGVRELSGN